MAQFGETCRSNQPYITGANHRNFHPTTLQCFLPDNETISNTVREPKRPGNQVDVSAGGLRYKILGPRMVHDDRGCGLLRLYLESIRKRDADLLGMKNRK